MPARRAVLAGIAALLAGCSGPSDSNTDPQTERPPVESPSVTTTRNEASTSTACGAGLTVTADPFDPAEALPVRLSERGTTLVERAVDTGTAEGTHYSDRPPLEDGSYADVDRRFYRLAVEQTGQSEVPGLVLNVEMRVGKAAPTGATVVPFDDLPAVDRAALRYTVYESEWDHRGDDLPQGLSARKRPVPYPDGLDGSRFAAVSDQLWVHWQDRDWRVEAGERTTRTQYRFAVTPSEVATDREGFRAAIAETHLVERSQFDADEREILRTAAADQYEECEPLSETVASLRETLEEEQPLPAPLDDAWYVGLEDGDYRVEFRDWVV
jgi:hypothetical protein